MTHPAPLRRSRRGPAWAIAGAALAMLVLVLAVAAFVAVQRHPGWIERLPSGRLRHAATALLGRIAPASSALSWRLPPPPPTVIGMNLPEIRYYGSSVPFANLAMGADWNDSAWRPLSDAHQDANGAVRSLPADKVALRFLLIPATGPEGIDVQCTFAGSGTLSLAGGGETLAATANGLRFHIANPQGQRSAPWLVLRDVDPRRPLHDLDCRDTRLARSVRFRPAFLATLRGYGVIRFMDWQNANANAAVSWRDRHTPASIRTDNDGVAIEDMLALARTLHAAPWFVMPWNADDAYVARFARLVRDGLPAGLPVYVEVGNEVWNTGFGVGQQAVAEGLARGLASQAREAGLRRYAERTVAVMRQWESVFAGRPGLVRVLSTQHVAPDTATIALSYRDTAAHVDALATAPYFGTVLGGTGHSRAGSLRELAAILPVSMARAVDNRRIARRFGKRYIGYEGGQGLVLPAEPALLERLQHDPAMYDLYRRYLAQWRSQIGDTLCLLTSVSRPGPSGAWGLATREDEPLSQAPKLRAVREALAAR